MKRTKAEYIDNVKECDSENEVYSKKAKILSSNFTSPNVEVDLKILSKLSVSETQPYVDSKKILLDLSNARSFFASSFSGKLEGRLDERNVITEFLQVEVLDQKDETNTSNLNPDENSEINCSALYISGCPGTGKTAMVNEILESLQQEFQKSNCRIIKINCMALKSPDHIFKLLFEELSEKVTSDQKVNDYFTEVENLWMNSKSKCLAVLDELDSLLTQTHQTLYRLFEWTKHSQFRLIGISNSLDLIDSHLPRLQTQNCIPRMLNFAPYTASQISSILRHRLQSLPGVLHPTAVEICSRKVAHTGDIRRAFAVCRRSIDIAERDFKKGVGKGIVTVQHVMAATREAAGDGNESKVKELNVNAKVVLAVLVLMAIEAKDATKKMEMSIGKLHEIYLATCSSDKLHMSAVSRSEFFDLISLLETQGLVSISTGATTISSKAQKAQKAKSTNRKGGQLMTLVSKKGVADRRSLKILPALTREEMEAGSSDSVVVSKLLKSILV
ncbi:AAA ATPase [Nowakowskiella sp. JEL0078]|nr:AAA ATPase [Nowakowskiella sp. JEL0078]